jgi:hypothetical protein
LHILSFFKVARELIKKASKFYQIYKEKDLLDIYSEDPESGGEMLHACSNLLCTYPLSGML